MSDYIKISDFAVKDSLLTGNPAKLVKGTEIDAEFDAIAVAVATKADTADKLSVFAATTSAELAGVISDETGSGSLVFANTPTLVTPNIGAATGSSLNLGSGALTAGSVSAETGNTAANAIQARYNSSNPPVSLAATTSNAFPYVGFNTVQKVSSDGQTYAINYYASRIKASNGGVSFDIAGSGTAGADISWTQAMTLDASGNLGLGVTPSAWSAYAAQQNQRLGLYGSTGNGGVSFNTYYDGAAWRYIGTDYATNYDQYIGQHRWYSAASGTAGNTITWGDPKMTLDANGNLIQKLNSSAPILGTNSTMAFELTSNTSLKITVRGTDGTTRSVSLTLA